MVRVNKTHLEARGGARGVITLANSTLTTRSDTCLLFGLVCLFGLFGSTYLHFEESG